MLKGKKERQQGKDELTLEINERLQAIQGIESITTSFGSQGGAAPVQLDITGEDMEKMRQIAGEVEGMLATIPGVSNIRNDFKEGKEKVTLLPKQEALARMQVDHRSLLQQISMLIGDQPVTTITTDGIEVDVVAKMPEGWLKHPEQLNQIMITSKTGAEVPLGDLVEWRYSKSPVTITHEKGERIVTVSAELLGSDLGTVAGRSTKSFRSLPSRQGIKWRLPAN